MKIQYLIDIKKALQDIPDEVLDIIGWGVGEDSEEVEMCIWDEDFHSKWEEYNTKYPQLNDISKWIKNLQEGQRLMDTQEPEDCEQFDELDEPISSDYKFASSKEKK